MRRAERADVLVRLLGELFEAAPADPFTPEVVAVPSRGVERWISQRLSTVLGTAPGAADGVCAHVRFPSPESLTATAEAAAAGLAEDDDDPWAEDRLAWVLLGVLDECAGEPWCATLGRHLGAAGSAGGPREGRRLAVARRLAALFTTYGAQRPQMLRAWAGQEDLDGVGGSLEEDLRWQAELWRRLRGAVGSPSPAERLERSCRVLRDGEVALDLPQRLSVFGATRLTTEQVLVLDALAARREVYLWLTHPSPALWTRLAGAERGRPESLVRTSAQPLARHPLLASLARDASELQIGLAHHAQVGEDRHAEAAGPGRSAVEGVAAEHSEPVTLLHRLQRDLRADRPPDRALRVSADDRSVQVHACHGRQRQVEVLREVILGLLEDDPTLEVRDMVVMCPDIEAYAPLVSAAFGLIDPGTVQRAPGRADPGGVAGQDGDDLLHPAHRLPVRLADRSLRQTNPVLGLLARLIELADARVTSSELLDLAALAPVRRRFRLDDDDLERVGDWVRRSGVRWGIDAEARAPYGLEGLPQNTWQAGLDRILLGAAMDEDGCRTLGLALPLDDVDSADIDLAGRLAELVDRVARALRRMSGRQPLTAWVDVLLDAVEDLAEVGRPETWQLVEARGQLAEVVTAAAERAGMAPLSLGDLRSVLASRLRGRPTRANFRTGHLTFCSMVPMRSVPHRAVFLLGLDDGAFPRGVRLDGDDVLDRRPCVGERDPRSEDRQLFLDAVLAAREHLVLLYTGADERSGLERPPAVPLGELLDVLDRTATAPSGRVRDHVVTRHPLQPFDPRSFTAGELGASSAFSFDRAGFAGANAARAERTPAPAFLSRPLAAEPPVEVVLEDLVRFCEHPVRAFLRQRLALTSLREDGEPVDTVPVSPDSLERWAVGDRLLKARLSGVPLDRALRAEWLRGEVPPGRLGSAVLDPLVAEVEAVVTAASRHRSGPAEQVAVRLELAGGPVLLGTVPSQASGVLQVEFSRLSPRHRLRAWVHLLALAASRPEGSWTAVTVGRAPAAQGADVAVVRAPDPAQAAVELASLAELRAAGMREPLPLPLKCSRVYAERRLRGMSGHTAVQLAEREWRRTHDGRDIGEGTDRDHVTVFGEVPFAELLTRQPVPGEARAGDAEEAHRFGVLAARLWGPLLAAEREAAR